MARNDLLPTPPEVDKHALVETLVVDWSELDFATPFGDVWVGESIVTRRFESSLCTCAN